MLTSLRAIVELQNPAIRDRHWHQLMKATGVKFEMNETTTLADLLALQLHRVEDEVSSKYQKLCFYYKKADGESYKLLVIAFPFR